MLPEISQALSMPRKHHCQHTRMLQSMSLLNSNPASVYSPRILTGAIIATPSRP
jgi:hypothetical protein